MADREIWKGMAVAKKKATRKKTVEKRVARDETPRKKVAKTKPPAMKAAVRVTKKTIKRVNATSKPASSPPATVPESPTPTPPESPCLADVSEPQPVHGSRTQKAMSVSEEEIRHRAYLKWEAAGRPDGDGASFWSEAERELLQGQ